ncbi:hypothetical protein BJP36_04970 [Moorena producens JHB]|uniref:Uncharacterized protein n=1 Tax=Moorena producens (strain JHB) TaxID=1454205 RepID=A0A1D9FVM0_MOOP1|nr:hypothetical protein [Moorena producens]AOY79365.1 hypothetical protein BJP36_04970 [Moorena producens JHB]
MSQINPTRELLSGIFILFGIHIIAITIVIVVLWFINLIIPSVGYQLNTFAALSLMGIGISQLIYVIPLIIRLKQQQRWEVMKGVIIGAVLTALLNGGCWLFIFYALQ